MDTKDILNEIEEIQKRPVEEQIDFYKKALQRDEEKTESRIYLYFNYAVLMYQYGDFRKAMEILEPFLMDYQSYPYIPKMISCFNLMGVATHCEKEYAVSRYYYSVALKIAQDNEDVYTSNKGGTAVKIRPLLFISKGLFLREQRAKVRACTRPWRLPR